MAARARRWRQGDADTRRCATRRRTRACMGPARRVRRSARAWSRHRLRRRGIRAGRDTRRPRSHSVRSCPRRRAPRSRLHGKSAQRDSARRRCRSDGTSSHHCRCCRARSRTTCSRWVRTGTGRDPHRRNTTLPDSRSRRGEGTRGHTDLRDIRSLRRSPRAIDRCSRGPSVHRRPRALRERSSHRCRRSRRRCPVEYTCTTQTRRRRRPCMPPRRRAGLPVRPPARAPHRRARA